MKLNLPLKYSKIIAINIELQDSYCKPILCNKIE